MHCQVRPDKRLGPFTWARSEGNIDLIDWLGIFVPVARESRERRINLAPWKFVIRPYCHLWRKRCRIVQRAHRDIDPLRACVIPDKQMRPATAGKEAQAAGMRRLA